MKRAILFCLPLVLAACGAPSEPPEPSEPPASDVIGDPLHQSLEKAQSVEGLNARHKDNLDEAVDAAN